ncbi:endonuclease/exonuclease/phosphatase family protein [Hyphobacterium sp.]|uniref:endonuclease/exonuclease/phosphatase family protein n=1 Tax=Hyphobacterium sp. TaxID=2004662 RepID=UPI003BAAA2B5
MALRFKRRSIGRPYLTDLAAIGLGFVAIMLWIAPAFGFADLYRQIWPLWALACIALVIWAVWRVPSRGIAIAVLTLAIWLPSAGSFWQTAFQDTSRGDSGDAITLASHNLWGRNRAHDLTIDVLREIDADILALQEAGVRTRAIHTALDTDYPFEAECGRAPVRLYSRLPIIDSGCMRDLLDANRSLGDPEWYWDFPASNWARIRHPGGEDFVVVNVHFTWPNPLSLQDQERINFAQIVRLFEQDTLIILGDFNAAAPSAALARFDRDLTPTRRTHSIATWPSQGRWIDEHGNALPMPTLFAGIDHIYAGVRWQTVDIKVGPNTGSDHRPVIGRFVLWSRRER